MKRILFVFLVISTMIIGYPSGAWTKNINENLKDLADMKGAFTFGVIGDNRSGDRVYSRIVAGIMARAPLFIVNTGDLIPTPGNRDQWKNFWNLSKPVTVPYFLVPGNHDIDEEDSQKVWRDEVDLPGNETYYSFVVGKNLFVVLNSCEPEEDRRIAGEQLTWLKKTLDPSRYRHQFVFLHHPPFMWKDASHYEKSLDRYPELRDALHRLFAEKGVTAVIAGHEHTFKRLGKRDGVEYIVTGGAGAPLYSGYNNYMLITVDGATVAAKVTDREGYLRDEFFILGPKGQ